MASLCLREDGVCLQGSELLGAAEQQAWSAQPSSMHTGG